MAEYQIMGIHNLHAELFADVHFEAGAAGILPAGQGGHRVAVHQRLDVAAHAFAPSAWVRVNSAGLTSMCPASRRLAAVV